MTRHQSDSPGNQNKIHRPMLATTVHLVVHTAVSQACSRKQASPIYSQSLAFGVAEFQFSSLPLSALSSVYTRQRHPTGTDTRDESAVTTDDTHRTTVW